MSGLSESDIDSAKDLTGASFWLGNGLTLRLFTEQDAESLLSVVKRNEAHLMEYMHWMTPEYSIDSAKAFLRDAMSAAKGGRSLSLGIFRDNDQIGSIGFVSFDRLASKTEIGYWIDKVEEGQGIISNACGKLIEFAFNELSMNRIEIRCSARNVRSAAIPRRFRFKEEACLRESECRNGMLHDFLVFGLLKREWNALNKS